MSAAEALRRVAGAQLAAFVAALADYRAMGSRCLAQQLAAAVSSLAIHSLLALYHVQLLTGSISDPLCADIDRAIEALRAARAAAGWISLAEVSP